MKKTFHYFLLILLMISPFFLSAQLGLIPYLGKDGLYGLSDVTGKMIVDPNYEEIIFQESEEYIVVKKNGLYGILNPKGEVILKPVMESRQGFLTFSAFSEYGDEIKPPRLYSFQDYKNTSVYYVNPTHPLDQYKPFMPLNKGFKSYKKFLYQPEPT